MRLTVGAVTVFALLVGACGNNTSSSPTPAAPTATASGPGPTTGQQVCDAQAWPRPVPQVVGIIFDDAVTGSLSCWDNLKAITPDGHNVFNGAAKGTYQITDVSPAAGTPIARNDWVTLHIVPVDLPSAPPAFHPCDWVTVAEAAKFLGDPSATTDPVGNESGSAAPYCAYNSGAHFVTSGLRLPASFPVDARTELDMTIAGGHGSDVSGLSDRAYCATTASGGKQSTTLLVLLSGNRLYQALGWDGESCEILKQFAQVAIPRVGP